MGEASLITTTSKREKEQYVIYIYMSSVGKHLTTHVHDGHASYKHDRSRKLTSEDVPGTKIDLAAERTFWLLGPVSTVPRTGFMLDFLLFKYNTGQHREPAWQTKQ